MKKVDRSATYYETDLWVRPEASVFRVGISDIAQAFFGDISGVELPKVGAIFKQHDICCAIESDKATNDIPCPISGEIIAINTEVVNHPEWVNEDCYDKGWLFKIKATTSSELTQLNSSDFYAKEVHALFNKQR